MDMFLSEVFHEKYPDVVNDLYRHSTIDENEMFEIYDDYKCAKDRDLKNRNDNFEL